MLLCLYCVWSCLTDAVRRHFLGSWLTDAVRRRASVVARTHFKIRSVVKNGPGDRYKQDPFQGTISYCSIRKLYEMVLTEYSECDPHPQGAPRPPGPGTGASSAG